MKIYNAETLVRTLVDTWYNGSLNCTILNIFTQLEKVVCLIHKEKGGKDLVETKRGPTVNINSISLKKMKII